MKNIIEDKEMNRMTKHYNRAFALMLALMLAACGGNSKNSSSLPEENNTKDSVSETETAENITEEIGTESGGEVQFISTQCIIEDGIFKSIQTGGDKIRFEEDPTFAGVKIKQVLGRSPWETWCITEDGDLVHDWHKSSDTLQADIPENEPYIIQTDVKAAMPHCSGEGIIYADKDGNCYIHNGFTGSADAEKHYSFNGKYFPDGHKIAENVADVTISDDYHGYLKENGELWLKSSDMDDYAMMHADVKKLASNAFLTSDNVLYEIAYEGEDYHSDPVLTIRKIADGVSDLYCCYNYYSYTNYNGNYIYYFIKDGKVYLQSQSYQEEYYFDEGENNGAEDLADYDEETGCYILKDIGGNQLNRLIYFGHRHISDGETPAGEGIIVYVDNNGKIHYQDENENLAYDETEEGISELLYHFFGWEN